MGAQNEMEQSAAHCRAGSTEATDVAVLSTSMSTEVEGFIGQIVGHLHLDGEDDVAAHILSAIEHDKTAQQLGGDFEPSLNAMLHEVELADLLRSHRAGASELRRAAMGLRMATFGLVKAVNSYATTSTTLDELAGKADHIASGG